MGGGEGRVAKYLLKVGIPSRISVCQGIGLMSEALMALELPQRDPCPFCENLLGRITADGDGIRKLAFIERLDLAAAFVNPGQSRHGHVLVIPTRYATTVLNITESEAEAVARLAKRVARALYDAFDPVGINIFQNNGIGAGQSIPHYHVHVVPRYPGDNPEVLLGRDTVLLTIEERFRLAEEIAKHMPN